MRLLIGVFLWVATVVCYATTNAPITLRYITTGHFNDRGYISNGTIFWATNHLSDAVSIHLTGFEVKEGSNWVSGPQIHQVLSFRRKGESFAKPILPAQASGYATVQLSPLPSTNIWRAKALVAPVLTGLADKRTRIKRYPDVIAMRARTGDTNISLNPFATQQDVLRRKRGGFQ